MTYAHRRFAPRRALSLAAAFAALAGICSAAPRGTAAEEAAPAPAMERPAVLDLAFASARLTLPLEELAARVALEPGQNKRVILLGSDEHTSHHLVAIRDREEPHRHPSDLLVVILRGEGTMRVGEEKRPVGRGSILYVPRGVLHAFRNLSPEPAVAYAVYSPPLAPPPAEPPH